MPEFDATESDEYQRIEPFERAIFERMNQSRRSQSLQPVEWDEVLAYIARLHSRNMSQNDNFAHEDKAGRDPQDRISGFKYGCDSSYTENIFLYPHYYPEGDNEYRILAKEAVKWWRNSPPHRRAMWSEAVEVAGVGCYINADNDIYVTCDFCTHDPADAEDAGTGTPPEDCYYGGERP